MNPNQVCIASVLFRIYLCGLAVVTWFTAMHESRSMGALVAQTSEGYLLMWAMLACGVVGLLDVIVNETSLGRMLPFESARTYRHFGYAGLAFCYVAQLFIAVLKLASVGLATYCLWNALFSVAFALFDAHQRSKETPCLQPCN
jgi:protein-S-isoprenylcysteine O-methyltransferase Ste14